MRRAATERWVAYQSDYAEARRRWGLTIPAATDDEILVEAQIREERQEMAQLDRIRGRTHASEAALAKLMARIDKQAQLEAAGESPPAPWPWLVDLVDDDE